jgi:hypothetical protein
MLAMACGGKGSPTSPSGSNGSSSTPSAAREIQIQGELGYGDVLVGTEVAKDITIRNVGNTPMTVTSLQVPAGGAFTASWINGQIPANGSQNVRLFFKPSEARSYDGNLTVQADHTTGNNQMRIAARGVLPLFSRSGVGDTVFDMPASVARVRIQAAPTTNCQNFIVRIGGRASIVNVILGTCSVADAPSLDSTYLTGGGGVVEITKATGVRWTIEEVR